MEETSIQADEKIEREPGSGSILAFARKKQKLSVEEIAEQLNLSVSQIRSIELDQSEGLPEPTYVRGYIRSYAKLLNLDEKEVLDNYLNPNWQKGSSLDEMPRGIEVHEQETVGRITPKRILIFSFLVGALAALAYGGYLNIDSANKTTSEELSESPSSPVIENKVVPSDVEAQSTQVQSESDLLEQNSENIEIEPQIDANNTDAVVASQEYQLELTFTDTCWVDIRDANDKKLAYKSYVKGEVLNISSPISMNVFIGSVSAVSARVGGEDFDLSPFKEGVFARFSIPTQ